MKRLRPPWMICQNCEHWEPAERQPSEPLLIGRCHVDPPVACPEEHGTTWKFPVSAVGAWCGKFEPDGEFKARADFQNARGNLNKYERARKVNGEEAPPNA